MSEHVTSFYIQVEPRFSPFDGREFPAVHAIRAVRMTTPAVITAKVADSREDGT
jgi:hypothetical protein